ncbi:MAG TPA: hypothetical protein DCS05_00550 [Nitrospiraceae bacterium]|nr:hypothetical protein [Nitrospiraceae bacterium]
MLPNLPDGLKNSLLWSDELGRGWCGKELVPYDSAYWQKYLEMDATDLGAQLTAARVDMVRRHFKGQGVDVGIGGGRFAKESGFSGYDVNKDAVAWLKSGGRYSDPYQNNPAAVTCWDSLEHIPNPDLLLESVREWLFVSMPIYEGQVHCLKSKHYRPGEHIHYFTFEGFVSYCAGLGFRLAEYNTIESDLGREGIVSFAFKRVK